MHYGSVYLNVFVDQYVPEADHLDPTVLEVLADASVLAQTPGNVPALLNAAEVLFGHDMTSDVERGFNGKLEKPFGTPVMLRIGYKGAEIVMLEPFEDSPILRESLEAAPKTSGLTMEQSPLGGLALHA